MIRNIKIFSQILGVFAVFHFVGVSAQADILNLQENSADSYYYGGDYCIYNPYAPECGSYGVDYYPVGGWGYDGGWGGSWGSWGRGSWGRGGWGRGSWGGHRGGQGMHGGGGHQMHGGGGGGHRR